jgi:predicted NAD-dependent protein-ADP-ribosyltransferase YbiA (DUF1768 family)
MKPSVEMRNSAIALLLAAMITVMFSGCAHTPSDPRAAYPAKWFTPVVVAHPPAWEILPQAAGPGEVILSKRNELGILSNFAATSFQYRGKKYASVEGFWQMMHFPEAKVDGRRDPRLKVSKRKWKYKREKVAGMTAFAAKKAGDHAEKIEADLGIDWVSFEGKKVPYWSKTPGEHYKIIREAMVEKMNQNPEVKRVLLSTGDLILKPDHHSDPDAPPEWRYYEIWMKLRSELQKEN